MVARTTGVACATVPASQPPKGAALRCAALRSCRVRVSLPGGERRELSVLACSTFDAIFFALDAYPDALGASARRIGGRP